MVDGSNDCITNSRRICICPVKNCYCINFFFIAKDKSMGGKSSKRSGTNISGYLDQQKAGLGGGGTNGTISVPTEISVLINEEGQVHATEYIYPGGVVAVPAPAIVRIDDRGTPFLTYPGIISQETFSGTPSTQGRPIYVIANVVQGKFVQGLGIDPSTKQILFSTTPSKYNLSDTQTGTFVAGISIQIGQQIIDLEAVGVSATQSLSDTGVVNLSIPQLPNVTLSSAFFHENGTPVSLKLLIIGTDITTIATGNGTTVQAVSIVTPSISSSLKTIGQTWEEDIPSSRPVVAAFLIAS